MRKRKSKIMEKRKSKISWKSEKIAESESSGFKSSFYIPGIQFIKKAYGFYIPKTYTVCGVSLLTSMATQICSQNKIFQAVWHSKPSNTFSGSVKREFNTF